MTILYKNAIKFGIEQSDIVTSVSHSLAQQTYEIINTKKEIIPIYNFVRKMNSQLGIMKN